MIKLTQLITLQISDFQVALIERDKIIQELTDSLKQSIEIRDQLIERNEALANQAKELKELNQRRRWITDRQEGFDDPEKRLSQTTIDLVSESDFEDDDFFKKTIIPSAESAPKVDALEQVAKKQSVVTNPNPTIEEFKNTLNEDESKMFTRIQEKFDILLNDNVNDVKEKLQQEQLEKAELETEASRIRHLLVNIKTGSTEVMELRSELDKIHKKEMENLRMYFERKCTDLEKQ